MQYIRYGDSSQLSHSTMTDVAICILPDLENSELFSSASSEGSGEPAHMRRLPPAFTFRLQK